MSNTEYRKPLTIAFAATAVAVIMTFSAPALAAGTHGGGHGHAEERGHGHPSSLAFGEPGKASDVDRTVEITMGDNFYDHEAIVVRTGETVRFVLENRGDFLHEFNIGTAAMHAAHQEEMMAMMESGMMTATGMNRDANDSDMGSKKGVHAHDDPNSVLLEPGRKRELIWTFAKTTGLEFACNVPGHYESGMKGTFKFKQEPHAGS